MILNILVTFHPSPYYVSYLMDIVKTLKFPGLPGASDTIAPPPNPIELLAASPPQNTESGLTNWVFALGGILAAVLASALCALYFMCSRRSKFGSVLLVVRY